MSKRSSFNFFELYVDKIVLGLAGAFALAMVWMYLLNSPNAREFNGQRVTPATLDDAILQQATMLQSRVRGAKAAPVDVPKYSEVLRRQFTDGVLGAPPEGAPPLPPTLRRVAMFGTKIEVPGLADQEEAAGSVAVITPVKPDRPVVTTGRSLVHRKAATIGGEPSTVLAADADPKDAVETPWVTIAAYFDRKVQQEAMKAAGYSLGRSRVYFVGVDVQRQERLSSGEWSEWRDVQPGKAMPQVEIPNPEYDEVTGAIKNKDAIEQALNLVSAHQNQLMQPFFYSITSGDEWVTPPLEGHEPEPIEDEPKPRVKPKKEEREPRAAPGRTPPPIFGGPRSGGILSPGGGGPRGAGGFTPPPPSANQGRAQAAKQAEDDLKQAKSALKDEDFVRAMQLAQQILANPDARESTKKGAEGVLDDAQKAIEKQAAAGGGMVVPGGGPRGLGPPGMVVPGGGPRGAAPMQTSQPEATTLVTHPETGQPAVWFHDDSAEAGKTYRYRMRSKIWNRYVGQMRIVKNPESAKRTVLPGEWSAPSDPIEVRPSTYFFVRSTRADKQNATVEVWKWRDGNWLKESFDVAVGESIGGVKKVRLDESDARSERVDVDFSTGAVVLDLRFDEEIPIRRAMGKEGEFRYDDRQTAVLVYLDPADGQVKQRVEWLDRYDPVRKQLGGEGS
ncbi:MAG: hypothetical protein AB7Q17_08400 [Phycisphaerae bacterium]